MKILFFLLSNFINLSTGEAKITASICTISVNREACPGRETEAWYPYQGVNPTSHSLQSPSQEKCVIAAQRMANIARKGVLKKVAASASFNGTGLTPVVSEASCDSANKSEAIFKSDSRLSKGVVINGSSKK